MKSHLDELSGAVKTLESADRFFALTNSEGAIHALNYQLQAKTKFTGMVLTGAPGRSIGQIARTQIVNQLASLPNRETIIKRYDDAITSFVNGKHVVPDTSLPEVIKQLLSSLNTPANLPFSRELWAYDTSEVISKIKEPILVIIGKKDIQVDWQVDGKVLEGAADKNTVSFVYPENADHVLKFEEKPREKLGAEVGLRYNVSDRKLDPEAANAIVNWLINRV
jgi:esterase/lipase